MALPDLGKIIRQEEERHLPALPSIGLKEELDAWAGQRTSNITTRIADHIFDFEVVEDLDRYHLIIQNLISAAAANPNADRLTVASWQRDFYDLDDQAHSEGRKHIMIAKYRKLLFKIMSNVSRGDLPHVGLSGVSAMITSRVQQGVQQEVRMPAPPPAASGGIFGFLNPFRRRE